jgi:hypothetical protein
MHGKTVVLVFPVQKCTEIIRITPMMKMRGVMR